MLDRIIVEVPPIHAPTQPLYELLIREGLNADAPLLPFTFEQPDDFESWLNTFAECYQRAGFEVRRCDGAITALLSGQMVAHLHIEPIEERIE